MEEYQILEMEILVFDHADVIKVSGDDWGEEASD